MTDMINARVNPSEDEQQERRDLFSNLLKASDFGQAGKGQLSKNEVYGNIFLFLFAGEVSLGVIFETMTYNTSILLSCCRTRSKHFFFPLISCNVTDRCMMFDGTEHSPYHGVCVWPPRHLPRRARDRL